ncbi:MAG TPA: conjugal transfer protein TraK [Muricauda sp.]|nr:conjugal transfer protein TraK [uncultured Allomuricauda sp.]MBC73002.1 conjugal transfer protein TraK [Allomuricauda sp.]HBU77827.1 conjugal transfer protein TraK [Allomuricauda sp.]|tara:strand:+ start:28725 stop:29336 length:612 start_codon:yes stop_codon:yes gene_type:complete
MKTMYKNIDGVLRANRFVVLAVVTASSIATIISGLVSYRMYQETKGGTFAIGTDGSVIPLKWAEQKENLEVEALAHLELFHNYFYGIDASNYKRNIEKALWLGDSSVDNVYRQKKADGVYNRLLQYSLVQKIISVDTELVIQEGICSFKTVMVFEIDRGAVTDTYELRTSGQLITVDRHFPKNPHGLLITAYFENQLKKVDDL